MHPCSGHNLLSILVWTFNNTLGAYIKNNTKKDRFIHVVFHKYPNMDFYCSYVYLLLKVDKTTWDS